MRRSEPLAAARQVESKNYELRNKDSARFREPWLISLTHDLPSSLALSGCPVHVAASQLAPFSLDE